MITTIPGALPRAVVTSAPLARKIGQWGQSNLQTGSAMLANEKINKRGERCRTQSSPVYTARCLETAHGGFAQLREDSPGF